MTGESFSSGGARARAVPRQRWKGGHGSALKFNPFKSWGAQRERGLVGGKKVRETKDG